MENYLPKTMDSYLPKSMDFSLPVTVDLCLTLKVCFLNLECRYLWEREIKDGDTHVLMCLEVVNICADEVHLDEIVQGRYGEKGYIYNVHYPINPENFEGKSHDWIAILEKFKDMGEY